VWSCTSIPSCPNGIKRVYLNSGGKCYLHFQDRQEVPTKVNTCLQAMGFISQKAVVLAFFVKITQKFMHT